jgi:hypothetical protein
MIALGEEQHNLLPSDSQLILPTSLKDVISIHRSIYVVCKNNMKNIMNELNVVIADRSHFPQ